MKVAFLCSNSSWGGLEINNIRLCSWLLQRGQQPVLLCHADSRIAREAAQEKVPTVEFEQTNKHIPFAAAFRLLRILRDLETDTMVIAHYKHHYAAVWAKIFSGKKIKLVYWQQMQVVLNRKDFYHSFFYRNLDAWISPLNVLKQQLLTNTVLEESKIYVIPLGVDLSRFLGISHRKAEARKFFGLPPDEFLAGIVGRFDQQKGQETLLRAVKNLKDRGKAVKGILIGEASYGNEGYEAYLKEMTKTLGIEKEIYFKPFMKDVAMAFACLDVFVMASLSETMGMVTVEAMASGVPVIGTSSGGTPELLDHGRAGMLFEPANDLALADCLVNLLENPERREALSREAMQRTTLYSHERQCQLFEELVRSLHGV
jgi:D-inositol-3-phosphate glycosyltransferase